MVAPLAGGQTSDGDDLIEGGLVISSPEDGQAVAAGSSITVTVEPAGSFEANRVMLLSKVGVRVLERGPFEFELEVPEDHLGALELSATGEDESGNFATADPIIVMVEASSELVALDLSPDEVYLNGINDRRQLRVTGEYGDGVSRDLTGPATGTTFSSADPAIATVSDNGILRPRSNGVTTVIASNGGLQVSMRAEVLRISESH
ncbi:MAG: hypothetical protein WD397_04060 [Wenzhouxiangellaceae bacterium]